MANNVQSVLREEIVRLARREIRIETEKLKRASTQYRSHIAELKRQVAGLQKQVTQLTKVNGKAKPIAIQAVEIDVSKVRWSPTKLRRHRERLEMSPEKFAKLFGVAGQTIRNWEAGTRPGPEHLIKVSQLRRLSKTQAHATINAS